MTAHNILVSGPREVWDTPLSVPASRRCLDCLTEFSSIVEATTADDIFDNDSRRPSSLRSAVENPVETCP